MKNIKGLKLNHQCINSQYSYIQLDVPCSGNKTGMQRHTPFIVEVKNEAYALTEPDTPQDILQIMATSFDLLNAAYHMRAFLNGQNNSLDKVELRKLLNETIKKATND
jgi:hypothetical protein